MVEIRPRPGRPGLRAWSPGGAGGEGGDGGEIRRCGIAKITIARPEVRNAFRPRNHRVS